jgi:hypothetical protein
MGNNVTRPLGCGYMVLDRFLVKCDKADHKWHELAFANGETLGS